VCLFIKTMTITDELNPAKGSPLGILLMLPEDQWRYVLDLRADRFDTLPNRWLEGQTVEALLLPTTLTAIGDGVLSSVEGLECVDLSHTAVRTIGSAFLAHSLCVTRVRFPPTLEGFGRSCLEFTSIKRVDLSATRVTRLPKRFLYASSVEVVLLPASLIGIGHDVFRLSQLRRLNLRHTALESLGADVFAECAVEEVLSPSSVKELGGRCFALSPSLRRLDLEGTAVTLLPEGFCCKSGVEEIRFPNAIRRIGNGALAQCNYLEVVDLSDTALEEIGDSVLRCCQRIREAKFPRTLRRAGSFLLAESPSLRKLCLKETSLECVGQRFLFYSGVESVWFPDTLGDLGDCALCFTSLKELDLSNTKLTRLDFFLIASNEVRSLVLPQSLIELGGPSIRYFAALGPNPAVVADRSCVGALVHLDLSHTQVQEIGLLFLYGAVNLQTLRLPATLEKVGERFLCWVVQLQSLDLSATNLTELPFGFGLVSGLKDLHVPSTLQAIGDQVLQRTKIPHLDLSHTKVTRIGKDFARRSPLQFLLCPPTLQWVGAGFPVGVMSPQLAVTVE
jgi:Leucine-rich repeat (LRR) protein